MYMDRAVNVIGALVVALGDRLSPREPGRDGRIIPPAALVHLSHCRRPTIESLRGVLGLSHPAAVRLADRLEAQGLAARTTDPQDARAITLQLTEAGRRAAGEALTARAATLSAALEVLTVEERESLAALSAKLLSALAGDRADLYRLCRLCDFEACDACPVHAATRP